MILDKVPRQLRVILGTWLRAISCQHSQQLEIGASNMKGRPDHTPQCPLQNHGKNLAMKARLWLLSSGLYFFCFVFFWLFKSI